MGNKNICMCLDTRLSEILSQGATIITEGNKGLKFANVDYFCEGEVNT